MKKIILSIGIVAGTLSSFAQGYVTATEGGTYSNQTNNTVLTSGWTGGLAGSGNLGATATTTSGGAYNICLLTTAGTAVTTLFGDATLATDWSNTGLQGANNTFAGRLNIGSGLQAANAPVGVTQSWMLVAWSSNLGTWSQVESALASGSFTQAGYVGWSLVGTGAAGAAAPSLPLSITGAATAAPIIGGSISLLAVPVPEPSTMALAALGGASLLLFRRRK